MSLLQDENVLEWPCKGCVFARFIESGQCGCELHILSTLSDKNVQIEKDKDGNCVIINRICPFKRTSSWYPYHQKNPDKSLAEFVREEVSLHSHLSIAIYIAADHTFDDLKRTIDSLDFIPKHIMFINGGCKEMQPYSFIKWANKNVGADHNWNFELIRDPSTSPQRCLDTCFKKISKKAAYIMIINAGHEINNEFVDKLDTALFDDLEVIPIVLPDEDGNGMTCTTKVYGQFIRNSHEAFAEYIGDKECPTYPELQ